MRTLPLPPGPGPFRPVARLVRGRVTARHRRPSPGNRPLGSLVCFNSVAMSSSTPQISVASPTGQQWRIGHGEQEVVICEVGATLRVYNVGTQPRHRRLRTRRVVPRAGGARSWPRGPTGWPMVATPSTGSRPKPPSTSPNVTTPFTAWRAGCPGPSRPATRTSSRCACNSTRRRATPFRCSLEFAYQVGRDGLTVTTTASSRSTRARSPSGSDSTRTSPPGPRRWTAPSSRCRPGTTLDLDDRGLPTGGADAGGGDRS